jgi:cytochrome c
VTDYADRTGTSRRGLLKTISFAALGLLTASALALSAQVETPTPVGAAAAQDCSTFGVNGCTSQAHAGAVVYASICVTCHGEQFEGKDGPPLAGPGNALGDYRTVRRLFDYVASYMPDDDPGSLSEREYYDVVAFVLQANGLNPNGITLSASTLDDLSLNR